MRTAGAAFGAAVASTRLGRPGACRSASSSPPGVPRRRASSACLDAAHADDRVRGDAFGFELRARARRGRARLRPAPRRRRLRAGRCAARLRWRRLRPAPSRRVPAALARRRERHLAGEHLAGAQPGELQRPRPRDRSAPSPPEPTIFSAKASSQRAEQAGAHAHRHRHQSAGAVAGLARQLQSRRGRGAQRALVVIGELLRGDRSFGATRRCRRTSSRSRLSSRRRRTGAASALRGVRAMARADDRSDHERQRRQCDHRTRPPGALPAFMVVVGIRTPPGPCARALACGHRVHDRSQLRASTSRNGRTWLVNLSAGMNSGLDRRACA